MTPYHTAQQQPGDDRMEHDMDNTPSRYQQQRIRAYSATRPSPYPISNFQLRNTANDMDTSDSENDSEMNIILPSISETLSSLDSTFAPQNPFIPPPLVYENILKEEDLRYTPVRRHSTPVKSAQLPVDYPTTREPSAINRSNSVNSSHTNAPSRITSPVQDMTPTPGEPMVANIAVDIVQGFRISPASKQIGGKDNREPLPPHIISVNMNYFVEKQNMTLQEFSRLIVRASLVGYKKPLLVKDKLILSTLEDLPMAGQMPHYQPLQANYTKLGFKNLVVKHSSHNHGQKLLLRFSVMTTNGLVLQSVDSAEFETITRRGIEKQRQKDAIIKKKQVEISSPSTLPTSPLTSPLMQQSPTTQSPRQHVFQSLSPPSPKHTIFVTAIEPNMSLCEGGQLCKIYIQGLPTNVPLEDVSVFFGDKESQEVFCVKQHTIVCQIPSSARLMTGEVHINVSLDDRKSFIPSHTKFNYVAHNHVYNSLQTSGQQTGRTQGNNKSVMEELFRGAQRHVGNTDK